MNDQRDLTIVIEALRETAKYLLGLPYSTGIESALEEVANRIEEKRSA